MYRTFLHMFVCALLVLASPGAARAQDNADAGKLTILSLELVNKSRAEQKLPPLHSSRFAPDPAPTLRMGVDAMTTAALSILGKKA